MPKVRKADSKNNKQESIEATLWQSADKLRKNMDAAEYKHVVLGLIFLKYISDAFEVLHSKLVRGKGEYEGADPEDPNEYTAEKVFFVPPVARWKPISDNAKKTTTGTTRQTITRMCRAFVNPYRSMKSEKKITC